MFTSSTKRRIRRCHVVEVHWTSKKCTKKSDDVQSCCFLINPIVFLASSLWLLLIGSLVIAEVYRRVARWWEESTRLPPIWPGFESRRRRHRWVDFDVGFLPCSKRFLSGYSGISLFSKTSPSKLQLASQPGVFRGARISSLPTSTPQNACVGD